MKRTIVFSLGLMLTLSFPGCGKGEQRAETKTSVSENVTETIETAEKETAEAVPPTEDDDEVSQIYADLSAGSVSHYCFEYLYEKDLVSSDRIVYGNTAVGDLGKFMHDEGVVKGEDLEYIIFFDEDGLPENSLIQAFFDEREFIGSAKGVEDKEKICSMKWTDILALYGFSEGDYSDFGLKQLEIPEQTEAATLDLDDPDVEASCMIAVAIQKELYLTWDEDTLYFYGKWDKNTPFTKSSDWNIPDHGDIEYIVEMYGDDIGRVLCHDVLRDDSCIGDSELGNSSGSVAGLNWDDVLGKYGCKQGEYIKYKDIRNNNLGERN